MNINSHIIRISGKAELEQAMLLGEEYTIQVTGQVVKQEDHDNMDGTVDRVYVFKPDIVIYGE